MKFNVSLNGTGENPFTRYGLTQNPFPSLAEHPHNQAILHLQKLGADPIPDISHIRKHLESQFSKEFIELCCRKFVPGAYVTFTVTFNETP